MSSACGCRLIPFEDSEKESECGNVHKASFHNSLCAMYKPNVANELNQRIPLGLILPNVVDGGLAKSKKKQKENLQKLKASKLCDSGLVLNVVDGGLAKSKKTQKKENIQKLKSSSKVCDSGLVLNVVDGDLSKSKKIQKLKASSKVCDSGLVSNVVDGDMAKSKKKQKKENLQKLKASNVCDSGLVITVVDEGLAKKKKTQKKENIQKLKASKVCDSEGIVVDGGLAKSKKKQKKENMQKLKASKVCDSGLVLNVVDDGDLAKAKKTQKKKMLMHDDDDDDDDDDEELTFRYMAQLFLNDEPKVVPHHETDLSNELNQTSPFSLILARSTESLCGIDNGENLKSPSCVILGTGLVLLKNYVSMRDQVELVNTCQEFGMGPGGFYQPMKKNREKLNLQMMCFGRNWDPQTKYDSKYRSDGSQAPPLPDQLISLAVNSIQDSQAYDDSMPSMDPDICVVNFYTTSGRLGLHQDRDESKSSLKRGLPVVSISVGDSAKFLYGNSKNVRRANEVLLESGDVLIFGGKSRHVYHGVTNIIPNSAPLSLLQQTMLRPGRLNLTFREY